MVETNTESAPLNARMMTNIHVSLAWMPLKALLAHGRAISAGTSRNIGRHGGNTFNAAAPSEFRAQEVLAALVSFLFLGVVGTPTPNK
jgi:hypothetical protein